MTLQLSSPVAWVFAAVAGSLLHAPSVSALTCDGDAAPRWNPERSWPSSCELGVPTDGFAVLSGDPLSEHEQGGDGELQVFVQRVSDGAPLERYDGEVSQADATSVLFRSAQPFAANADFILVAQRVGRDGTPRGLPFTSSFSTGSDALASISFQQAAELSVEPSEQALHECTVDACGVEQCEPTGESEPVRLVRIAVPPIAGGIEQRPYEVSAQLTLRSATAQAPLVATSDTVVTQANQRSFMVVTLPALATDMQGCVTLTARDIAGHEASLEAGCMDLPADELADDASALEDAPGATSDSEGEIVDAVSDPAATPDELPVGDEATPVSGAAVDDASDVDVPSEELETLAFEQEVSAVEAAQASTSGQAQGCAVAGAGSSNAGSFGWLVLALTCVRLRARKRTLHAA